MSSGQGILLAGSAGAGHSAGREASIPHALQQQHALLRRGWDACRHQPDQPNQNNQTRRAGHYESYFQRANHPERPLAFWLRYTLFQPADQQAAAYGELWAIYFDGERNQISVAKQGVPLAQCRFIAGQPFAIGAAQLDLGADPVTLCGRIDGNEHRIDWDLHATSSQPPLLLLPEPWYRRGWPRAKAMVGSPNADFHGRLQVNGEMIAIDGWRGSLNHNWGTRHTDNYAWGQVAGFDGAPDAFLECASARVKIGPWLSPQMSVLVLRLDGEEYAANGLLQSLRARADLARDETMRWRMAGCDRDVEIEIEISAPASRFVGLRYANPPGGEKICLNSKLADCTLRLRRAGQPERVLVSHQRAAFEILSDEAGTVAVRA